MANQFAECVFRIGRVVQHAERIDEVEPVLLEREPVDPKAVVMRQEAVASGTWDARAEWVSALIENVLVEKELGCE